VTPAVLGAILTGGASTRLGEDKAVVSLEGRRVIDRVRESLSRVVSEIVVVGRTGGENPLPDLPFVADRTSERCALAGVVTALGEAGSRRLVLTACDHPFLRPEVLALLVARAGAADVRLPLVSGRLAPLVAVYEPGRAREALARRLEAGRRPLIRALNELDLDIVPEAEIRAVDPDLRSFLNLNTPADLARARRLVGEVPGD
jgi:molybdopterin-guanine dinucleotide biosynthesis protein A